MRPGPTQSVIELPAALDARSRPVASEKPMQVGKSLSATKVPRWYTAAKIDDALGQWQITSTRYVLAHQWRETRLMDKDEST